MDQVISPAGPPRFVVCLRNEEWPLDLKVGTVYRVLADPSAERSGWIRVIDETGEDYLYPATCFSRERQSMLAEPQRRKDDGGK